MTSNITTTAGKCTSMACARPGAPLFAFLLSGAAGPLLCLRTLSPPLSSNDAGKYTPTYSYVVVIVAVVSSISQGYGILPLASAELQEEVLGLVVDICPPFYHRQFKYSAKSPPSFSSSRTPALGSTIQPVEKFLENGLSVHSQQCIGDSFPMVSLSSCLRLRMIVLASSPRRQRSTYLAVAVETLEMSPQLQNMMRSHLRRFCCCLMMTDWEDRATTAGD
jgi:hypothetical protein